MEDERSNAPPKQTNPSSSIFFRPQPPTKTPTNTNKHAPAERVAELRARARGGRAQEVDGGAVKPLGGDGLPYLVPVPRDGLGRVYFFGGEEGGLKCVFVEWVGMCLYVCVCVLGVAGRW